MTNEYACVDADGRYGDRAKVYYVGSRAQCEARARDASLQVIALTDATVGDRVLRADVSRYAARYHGVVESARNDAERAARDPFFARELEQQRRDERIRAAMERDLRRA